jgi:hypothetical protein
MKKQAAVNIVESDTKYGVRIETRNISIQELDISGIRFYLTRIKEVLESNGNDLQVDFIISKRDKITKDKVVKWALVSPINRTCPIPILYRLIIRENKEWNITTLEGYNYYTFDADNKRFFCDADKQIIMVYGLLPHYNVHDDGTLSTITYKISTKLFDIRKY